MARKYVWGLELSDFLVSFDQYVRYQLDSTEAKAYETNIKNIKMPRT